MKSKIIRIAHLTNCSIVKEQIGTVVFERIISKSNGKWQCNCDMAKKGYRCKHILYALTHPDEEEK
jgi:hypothetical protein